MKKNIKVTEYAASETVGVAGNTSPAIDLTTEDFVGFQNASVGTSTVSFYGSSDGVLYGALYQNGTALTAASPPVNSTWMYLNDKSFSGVRYLKITTATGGRTIKIMTKIQ